MKQRMKVYIEGFPYDLDEEISSEETIRRAAADVDKAIKDYAAELPTRPRIEVATFIALNLRIQNLQLEEKIRRMEEEQKSLHSRMRRYLDGIADEKAQKQQ